MKNKQQKERGVEAISSKVFNNGVLVETIFNQKSNEASLAIRKPTGISVEETYTDRIRYKPKIPQGSLLKFGFIKLPSDIGDTHSYTQLIQIIRGFIHEYVDLPDRMEMIAAHYVLLSWVHDAFQEIPYLRIRGDLGTGKTRYLQVIGSICYRPIFASGSSTVSPIFHLLDSFGGTFVFDEADFRFSDEKSDLTKILNNGNAKGFPVLRTTTNAQKQFVPTAFNVFGPKIVAMRGSYVDQALESRFITETTFPKKLRTDIPVSLPETFESQAQKLRNILLRYRFEKFPTLSGSKEHVDTSLDSRIRQIMLPMLTVAECDKAKNTILEFAHEMSTELTQDRGWQVEAQILLVIKHLAEKPNTRLSIKNITKALVEQNPRDIDLRVSHRWVGERIRRSLGLKTTKSHGVFVLHPENSEKLPALYKKFDV